jgi:hypothetical protein
VLQPHLEYNQPSYQRIKAEDNMNLFALAAAGVAAYILLMSGVVIVVAADEDSKIGPVMTFGGWVLTVLAGVVVIGILAEIGNSTS